MTLIVSIPSAKGGVGKTTTVINLARAAHLRQLRTLIVDLDPGGHAADTLIGSQTTAEVLSAQVDTTAVHVAIPSRWDAVDVFSASGDTPAADVTTKRAVLGRPKPEQWLREALNALSNTYELVLIDSPPAVDTLTITGMDAAHCVLVVTTAELFALNGVAGLRDIFNVIKYTTNPNLGIAGIIANALDHRTRRQRHWMTELRIHAPAPIWEPPIPLSALIGETIEAGLGLDERGTLAATELAAVYDRYLSRLIAVGA